VKGRIVVTAGYDRALHAVALAELLRRAGHEVAGILVVSAFRVKRLTALLRQRGRSALPLLASKLFGMRRPASAAASPLFDFLRRENITARSLRTWANAYGVPHRVVGSLNDADAVAFLRQAGAQAVFYAGGGILRKPLLDAAAGRIVNAHSGPLPQIRGMNALEWSLLIGEPPTVTIHVIDAGIDTGGAIEKIPIPVEAGDTIESLREKCEVLGVQGLVRAASLVDRPLPARPPGADAHRQCFVMAPVLRELVERKLASRNVRR
jgi:folate-dependent phosphoribosylglycinamide formyltransferase PurN